MGSQRSDMTVTQQQQHVILRSLHSVPTPIHLSICFFFLKLYLFIYFCLCWVFVVVRELIAVASLVAEYGSRCVGFGSCDAWIWLPCDMWDLPRPGIEPMNPALAGRLLTSGPQGSPCLLYKPPYSRIFNLSLSWPLTNQPSYSCMPTNVIYGLTLGHFFFHTKAKDSQRHCPLGGFQAFQGHF